MYRQYIERLCAQCLDHSMNKNKTKGLKGQPRYTFKYSEFALLVTAEAPGVERRCTHATHFRPTSNFLLDLIQPFHPTKELSYILRDNHLRYIYIYIYVLTLLSY